MMTHDVTVTSLLGWEQTHNVEVGCQRGRTMYVTVVPQCTSREKLGGQNKKNKNEWDLLGD